MLLPKKALTGTTTSIRGLKAKALLHRSSANATWKALLFMVMGQDRSGENISLFLGDWELAQVASSCHMALDIVVSGSWFAAAKEALCHSKKKAFLSPWTGCGSQGAGCGERNRCDKPKS